MVGQGAGGCSDVGVFSRRVGASDQKALYREAAAPGGEGRSLSELDVRRLIPAFERFLKGLRSVSTEVLAQVGGSLSAAGEEVEVRLLEAFLARRNLEDLANSLGAEPVQLEFFPQAFLQPMVEAMVEPEVEDLGDRAERACPRCGWTPQVAVQRDEAELKGRRFLVCSLCSTWWSFRRSTCAGCGERDAETPPSGRGQRTSRSTRPPLRHRNRL